MGDMKGRVALVTAGSKGLGAEVVRELARRGADVAFTYKQDSAAAKMVAAQVRKLGRRCLALHADAGDFAKAHLAVAQAARHLGGLHILVCNAGIARSGPAWKMKETDWDDVMAVTLKDRKSTRLNSSHIQKSRMPSSA